MRKILTIMLLMSFIFAKESQDQNLNRDIQKYQNLTKQFMDKSFDSLMYYGNKTINLADKTNNIEIKKDVYYNIGYYYQSSAFYDSAAVLFEKALIYFKEAKDTIGIGKTKNQLGHIYWLKADHIKSKEYYEDAIKIHKKYDNKKELGKSLTNLANLYTKWGDYNKSIDLLLEAGDNYHQINFTEGLAWLDFSMSMLYKRVGEYEQALHYVKNSLNTYKKIAAQTKDSVGIRICYSQLGFLYTNYTDSLQKGLEYQIKTLRLAKKLESKAIIADGLSGVGMAYYKMGKYILAKDYFSKANIYRLESGIIFGISSNLKYLGYIADKQNNLKKAEEYYLESIDYTKRLNNRSIRRDVYKAFSELYQKMGDYKKSLNYLEKHISLKDSILSIDVTKKVASTQLKYIIEKKEQENEYLIQQNKIQELKIERTSLSRNILIISVVFVLLLLLSVLYLYINKSR